MAAFAEIALAKAETYEAGAVQGAIEELFASLCFDECLRAYPSDTKILIKPNLLMKRRPEETTTTHPAVVKAVILHLQGLGFEKIRLADSPGGPYHPAQLAGIYAATGMQQVAQETGISLNEDTGFQSVPAPQGRLCREFALIDPVVEADLILSIGKLKTHAMTGLSGAVKNLFGCIPGLQKPELHYRFAKKADFCAMLVELAKLVQPALTVIDAIDAMEGDGPSGGEKRHCGLLCAGRDPFVLDRFLCDLLGFAPEELPTVAEAIRLGYCPKESAALQIQNPDALPLEIPDFQKPSSKPVNFAAALPGFLQPLVGVLGERALSPKPVVQKSKCVGCGKCAESCPAHTITIQKGKAKIQLANCIKCFCCHEMCPVKAISIAKLGFFSL